jgi:D-alanyl-D-alanine carboxypeptidase/D-alanyl-D-alanine-endopeptidase (penicillin-binding protein 4)
MRTLSSPSTTRTLFGAAAACALLLGTAATATARTPSGTTTSTTTKTAASFATTTTVASYAKTAADLRIASKLTARVTTTRFGTAFTGAVLDAGSNTTVWRKNGDTAYKPASTNKLVTASNALTLFGPDARFTTWVRSGAAASTVILQGSGDPSLSSANLDSLARTTASSLRGRGITSVKVYVDDDVFPTPTLAYGWKSSYVPDSIAPVRGVVRVQRNSSDTSAEAARYLCDRLTAYGMRAGYWGRANAASTSTVLASSKGQSVSTLVSRMLLNSDNEIAEALHKLVSRKLGYGATWTGARTAQAKQLAAQGLKATALYDGSGLSRADRLTSLQLARIVDRGLDARYVDTLWPLQSAQAMPTAGRTGTLKYRFTTTASKCAVGKVWAKTGTLSDVVSLAGFTKGTDGRVKVFAFVVNGKSSTTTLKQNVDMLAATVNGCY